MGGIDKSTLLRKLLSEIKEKYSETRYAFKYFKILEDNIDKKIEEYEEKYDDIIIIENIEEYLRSKFEYSNILEFKLLLGYKREKVIL